MTNDVYFLMVVILLALVVLLFLFFSFSFFLVSLLISDVSVEIVQGDKPSISPAITNIIYMTENTIVNSSAVNFNSPKENPSM